MEQEQKQIKYFTLDLLNSQKWLLIDAEAYNFLKDKTNYKFIKLYNKGLQFVGFGAYQVN